MCKTDEHDAMEKFPLKGTSTSTSLNKPNTSPLTTYNSVDAKVSFISCYFFSKKNFSEKLRIVFGF
jgi:hypothetical protein